MAILQENWKDMIKTSSIDIERKNDREITLIVQPLEKGYGLTLGNALRRILLTSVRGFAITSVKIDGVFHEYDTISGIREDVYDIIMNIKSILFSKDTSNPSKMYLKANKKGPVLAGDIRIENGGNIINKDLVICNIEKDGVELNIEMVAEYDVGYKPAIFHDENKALGTIYLDAVFSPVKRVIYKVSNARVGQRVDYDKLELTVETNGTMDPTDAIAISAKILQTQLDVFVSFELNGIEESSKQVEDTNAINPVFLKKIDEMELSVRSYNCLKVENINLIGDLVTRTESEMLKLTNFGRKSLNELKDNLKALGLSFGMQIDNWPPKEEKENIKKRR